MEARKRTFPLTYKHAWEMAIKNIQSLFFPFIFSFYAFFKLLLHRMSQHEISIQILCNKSFLNSKNLSTLAKFKLQSYHSYQRHPLLNESEKQTKKKKSDSHNITQKKKFFFFVFLVRNIVVLSRTMRYGAGEVSPS